MVHRGLCVRLVGVFAAICALVVVGAADAGVSFDTEGTVVWRGRPQMVAFRLDTAAENDRTLLTRVDGGGLRVLEPGRVLKGETLGFVRVVADGPSGDGRATLRVGGDAGGAALAVRLGDAADPDERSDTPDAGPATPVLSPRPRIVSPAPGAVVWGPRTGVAVEAFDDPAWPDAPLSVRLRLPDGRRLAPVEVSGAGEGPVRRYGFVLDGAALAEGWNDLVAESSRDGEAWTGAPLPVFGLGSAATPDDVEAESRVDAPRPERYAEGGEPLNTSDDPEASGGVYVRNSARAPALTVPLTMDAAGWVQLRVTAGGDPAQGVLPAVGLRVGDEPQPRAASRIALRDWHETPVGVPVWFEAGDHTLVACFENDYSAGKGVDRNLKLDRFAVARLPAGWSPAPAAETGAAELDPSLDGRRVGGAFAVSGQVRTRAAWSRDDLRRPAATLWINGAATRTQHGFAPRFEVGVDALDPGPNRLELRAVDPDGRPAAGHAVTVRRVAAEVAGHAERGGAAVGHRFLAADPAWSVPTREGAPQLTAHEGAWGDPVWNVNSNAELTLNLPEKMSGRFAVYLDAAGDAFEGPPEVAVRYRPGAAAVQDVHTLRVTGGYWPRHVGEVELDGADGSAILVAFINDRYDADRDKPNDRNLRIRAVELRPLAADPAAPDVPDETDAPDPPRAVVVYPPDGHAAHGADAVVVELPADATVTTVRLLLDGAPWGPALPPDGGRTRLLLPASLRGVAPGTHTWSVRVTDAAGRTTDTPPRALRVRDAPPDAPGPYARAVRLLDRVAYGPEPAALADVLVDGAGPWLRRALARGPRPAGEAAAWSRASAAYPDARSGYALGVRAAAWLIETPNPARARLTVFIDNHFNTWWTKSRPESKGPEFARWVALGPAPFADLLRASATSASMVYYLDQQRSFAGRINENYAREVMELHTLGVHGGYTQADVTALAHVLTGWSAADVPRSDGGGDFNRRRWAWVSARHDGAAARVFGLEIPAGSPASADAGFDRPRRALEMLAAHPRTARHVAGKLAEHYLGVAADAERRADDVDGLAEVFTSSGGDLAEVVIALAQSEAFASADDAPRVAHPLGFAVRLARLAANPNAHLVAGFAGRSGFAPFGRETPDGYPEEDAAYADSNAMLQRWRMATDLEWALYLRLPEGLRHPPRCGDTPPDAGDPLWHQELVDQAALRFTGRLLSDRSNAAVLSVLAASDAAAAARGRLAASLVAQMPESSLR